MSMYCPVCNFNLSDPLPPFCDQCGWDFKHDITLVPSIHEIPENIRSEYIQRLSIARRVWNERGVPKEKAKEYFKKGINFAVNEEWNKAIEAYTSATTLDPNDALTYYNRGYAYDEKGEYDRAIADYTRAIELNPNDAVAYHNRGYAYRNN